MTKSDFLYDCLITFPNICKKYDGSDNTYYEIIKQIEPYAEKYKLDLDIILSIATSKNLRFGSKIDIVSIINYLDFDDDNEELKIPEGIIEIKPEFFRHSTISSIILPESLEIIHGHAFSHCENLTSIKFPSNLNKIGMYAFEACSNLENVTISNNTIVHYGAFTKTKYIQNVLKSNQCPDNIFHSLLKSEQILYCTNTLSNMQENSNFMLDILSNDFIQVFALLEDNINRYKVLLDFSVLHHLYNKFIEAFIQYTEKTFNYELRAEIINYSHEINCDKKDFIL